LIVERAHEAGALRSQDLKRVTVDTTVQPNAITFPTDAKLLHAAIKGLNRLARRHASGCGNPILA
jgi:IS5 family transposase